MVEMAVYVSGFLPPSGYRDLAALKAVGIAARQIRHSGCGGQAREKNRLPHWPGRPADLLEFCFA